MRAILRAGCWSAAAICAALVIGPAAGSSDGLRDAARTHRAEQITSTFENSTTTLQYAYAENLHDGRGTTAGRAGFCSRSA